MTSVKDTDGRLPYHLWSIGERLEWLEEYAKFITEVRCAREAAKRKAEK